MSTKCRRMSREAHVRFCEGPWVKFPRSTHPEIDEGYACLEMDADAVIHGNQQGTIHGGLLSELADAAMGTAHSTLIEECETFTSIDLRISFFRPVWKSVLKAVARPVQHGKIITHYQCEIVREDGKQVALAAGTFMTLRGQRKLT